MRIDKTVVIGIIIEGVHFGIVDRKAVLRGNPKPSVLVLHNAFDTIIYQSILLRQRLKALLSVIPDNTTIEAISVAADPQRPVLGLTKRGNLVNDARMRVIEQMTDSPVFKLPVLVSM